MVLVSRARQTDMAIATVTERNPPDAAIQAPSRKILGA
jgi:hypothetical protein